MHRREFLATLGSGAAGLFMPRWVWAAELPDDIRITRIIGFDLVARRPKFVGKNSRRDDHGDQATDRMVRLFTNSGHEGLGHCRASEQILSSLLEKSPRSFLQPHGAPAPGPLGNGTMPLWDLAGKILGKPAYELMGGRGTDPVPVYDGSIYLSDLLPEHASRWPDRFKEEIDLGFRRGHRAFKIKIGRGAKWMESKAGYERDLAVLKTIRQHAGPDVLLGVDANNGYSLASTKQLLSDLPDFSFGFVEEMFPETVEECLELKAFIRRNDWKTLVADGESQNRAADFQPFVEAKALDLLQGDMNHFGIEGILEEASLAAPNGLRIAPHNWGSLLGYYLQLHVGRAVPNFYRAENDPLDSDLLIADGYHLRDGLATVPEAPGFGLRLDEARFGRQVKVRFDLKS